MYKADKAESKQIIAPISAKEKGIIPLENADAQVASAPKEAKKLWPWPYCKMVASNIVSKSTWVQGISEKRPLRSLGSASPAQRDTVLTS